MASLPTDSTGRLLFSVFFLVWYGIIGYVYYLGANMISSGSEYSRDGTQEKCLLIDYDSTECTYDCNCETGNKNCGTNLLIPCILSINSVDHNFTVPDTCYGMWYDYEATVESKCGNETVFSGDLDHACPMTLKDIGSEQTCYVLGCDKGEFTFISPGTQITWGIVLICVISLFCLVPICCIVCCFG